MARKKAKAVQTEAETTSVEPTREEALALPYWPRVAFAARVARRVLPLVDFCWEKHVPYPGYRKRGHIAGTKRCVRLVQEAAAEGRVRDAEALYAARDCAGNAASYSQCAAEEAGRAKHSPPYAASYAAVVVYNAATAAYLSVNKDWMCEWGHIVGYAAWAGEAFGAADAVNAAMRDDYETLTRLIAAKGWGDQSPVPPGVFGRLWPKGAPNGWPTPH